GTDAIPRRHGSHTTPASRRAAGGVADDACLRNSAGGAAPDEACLGHQANAEPAPGTELERPRQTRRAGPAGPGIVDRARKVHRRVARVDRTRHRVGRVQADQLQRVRLAQAIAPVMTPERTAGAAGDGLSAPLLARAGPDGDPALRAVGCPPR